MLAPPLPAPLTDAQLEQLAAIDGAQIELAERLEIESQRIKALGQAARSPSEAPRWISLGRQLRPPQRYLFEGMQSTLTWEEPPPAARLNLQRMLALAVWLALAAGCWALLRGGALAPLATRWTGLLVVLAGLLWILWLTPLWLGVLLMVLGLWAAVRGERPPVLRRPTLAG